MIKMYTADWCSACKGLKKKIELAGIDVEYVDIDKEPEEARQLGVRGIPFLYNTETEAKLVGNISVAQLQDFTS